MRSNYLCFDIVPLQKDDQPQKVGWVISGNGGVVCPELGE